MGVNKQPYDAKSVGVRTSAHHVGSNATHSHNHDNNYNNNQKNKSGKNSTSVHGGAAYSASSATSDAVYNSTSVNFAPFSGYSFSGVHQARKNVADQGKSRIAVGLPVFSRASSHGGNSV
jgi:hypothetical protein